MSERFCNVAIHVSPPPRSLLVVEKTTRAMPRPPLDLVTNVGPRDLTISVPSDRSPTAHPATCADALALSPTSSPLELVHSRLQSGCATSPPRRHPQSRRQSSISYFPPDSPRLWTPRTPQTGPDSLEHGSPSSGANNVNKEGHARTRSIPQRAISEPVVLTLAERCVPRSILPPHPFTEQLNISYLSKKVWGSPPIYRPEGVQVPRVTFSACDTRV